MRRRKRSMTNVRSVSRRPGRNFVNGVVASITICPRLADGSDRDLLRPLGSPVLAQPARDGLIEVEDLMARLFEEAGDAPAVDRDAFGADDDGVAALDVVEAPAGRA